MNDELKTTPKQLRTISLYDALRDLVYQMDLLPIAWPPNVGPAMTMARIAIQERRRCVQNDNATNQTTIGGLISAALCPSCRNRVLGALEGERQRLNQAISYNIGEIAGIDLALQLSQHDRS